MSDIEMRLERLERSVRAWKAVASSAIALALVAMLVGWVSPHYNLPNTIEVGRIRLLNHNGVASSVITSASVTTKELIVTDPTSMNPKRVSIGVDREGVGRISMYDQSSRHMVAIADDSPNNKGAGISLFDRSTSKSLTLNTNGLGIRDATGIAVASIGLLRDDEPALVLSDPDIGPLVVLGSAAVYPAYGKNGGSLVLSDGKGDMSLFMGTNENKASVIRLFDPSGEASLSIGSGMGESMIALFDGELKAFFGTMSDVGGVLALYDQDNLTRSFLPAVSEMDADTISALLSLPVKEDTSLATPKPGKTSK